MARAPFWVVIGFVATACGSKTLVVESDTSWAGAVGEVGSVEGRGRATYELSATADRICWSLAKLSEAGTLRAYAQRSTFFGLGSDVEAEATTTAPLGSVTGCIQ